MKLNSLVVPLTFRVFDRCSAHFRISLHAAIELANSIFCYVKEPAGLGSIGINIYYMHQVYPIVCTYTWTKDYSLCVQVHQLRCLMDSVFTLYLYLLHLLVSRGEAALEESASQKYHTSCPNVNSTMTLLLVHSYSFHSNSLRLQASEGALSLHLPTWRSI